MRLDLFLVEHKNIESRTKAQDLIKNGFVKLKQGDHFVVLNKASFDISDNQFENIAVDESELNQFVSRAGLKLNAAIKKLNLPIQGVSALDIGQSTGGFTDCLIQLGANQVIGIDVGHSQLHEKFKSHPKVIFFENLNVKNLSINQNFTNLIQSTPIDLLVCDVSFISLTKVLASIEPFLQKNGTFLFLVKPQFECGPEYLDKNGIVSDTKVYNEIELNIKSVCEKLFNCRTDYFESAILGKDGNKEFFIHGKKN